MGKIKITSTDIEWLQKHYPGLRVKDETIIRGRLRFRAKMETESKPPLKRPPKIQIWHENVSSPQGKLYIEDHYMIEGYFDAHSSPHFNHSSPCFKETGGRLEMCAKEMEKPLIDLHIYPETKELCLGSPVAVFIKMEQINTIQGFFEELLIPYFYYHSYWKRHGREPWLGLKHGDAGILEGLADSRYKPGDPVFIEAVLKLLSGKALPSEVREYIRSIKKAQKIRVNDQCFCGSGKKVKNCCKKQAMEGFNKIIKVIKHYKPTRPIITSEK